MKHWIWVAADRAATWWYWHGPHRRRVRELEDEVDRMSEDMRLLIRSICELTAAMDSRGELDRRLRLVRETDPPA